MDSDSIHSLFFNINPSHCFYLGLIAKVKSYLFYRKQWTLNKQHQARNVHQTHQLYMNAKIIRNWQNNNAININWREAWIKWTIIDKYPTIFTCEKENLLKVEQTESRILKHLPSQKNKHGTDGLRYVHTTHRGAIHTFLSSCVFSI